MSFTDLSVGEPDEPQVAFDADELDDAPGELAPEELAATMPDLSVADVRALLPGVGKVLNGTANLVGWVDPDLPDQWKFTDDEMDGLAPPLTRIINRRPRLKRAAHNADYAVIAGELGGYFTRNMIDGHAAKVTRQEGPTDGDQHGQARGGRPRRPRRSRGSNGGADREQRSHHGADPSEVAGLGDFQG